ncbi:Leucine-rich repeat (LRR) protein [Lewinella marina]|uniref:Leucine-rich repeat domain-containing protein n=1 Tax=Neolewinella marina TaxID=438751 RepID=A0A2G0CCQ6_9BACT|nr:leucine-rich repeat domain-containing protein [Neolewinella marina]NJB87566.1 Leucine-rich repeat (LRR) protein [Neolewinella marina]PHK97742.1 hypothetical protein CGL56_15060 [Neolewinella marina]
MNRTRAWWNGLEPQWRQAFREAFFSRPSPSFSPSEEELHQLLHTQVLRLAGPGAPYSNLSIALTNLSGVVALRDLTYLSVTDCHITTLEELHGHHQLRSLFVQDNRLTSLKGIESCTGLQELYAQNNALSSVAPLRSLTRLHTLYVSGNALTNLDGLTPHHGEVMRDCFVLPNAGLPNREIIRLQQEIGLIPRRG